MSVTTYGQCCLWTLGADAGIATVTSTVDATANVEIDANISLPDLKSQSRASD